MTEELLDELAALMRETAVGENHGSSVEVFQWDNGPPVQVRRSLAIRDQEAAHGLSLVAVGDEGYHGMVAHRGVLSEAEYELLDWDRVEELVCQAFFGHTPQEVAEIYGNGRPGPERAAQRDAIDSQLLRIQEHGGNMAVLAAVLGWGIRETPTGTECRKMQKALARARERRDG